MRGRPATFGRLGATMADDRAYQYSLWPRRQAADFRDLERDEALLRNCSARTAALALGSAFPALLMPLPVALQTAIASVALSLYDGAARRPFSRQPRAQRGVLSVAVFRGSANANTERLAALLALDERRFAVALFTTQLERADAEQLRRVIEARGRRFRHTPLRDATDEQAAELVQRDGCDIALDCSGHTAGHRLTLLARRPCPVRTGVLGFAGSYGGGEGGSSRSGAEAAPTEAAPCSPRSAGRRATPL